MVCCALLSDASVSKTWVRRDPICYQGEQVTDGDEIYATYNAFSPSSELLKMYLNQKVKILQRNGKNSYFAFFP